MTVPGRVTMPQLWRHDLGECLLMILTYIYSPLTELASVLRSRQRPLRLSLTFNANCNLLSSWK